MARLDRNWLRPDRLFISSVWLIWIAVMSAFGLWHLFGENWFMSVTMAFGSFIAGSTSQGGGAVAFPVMTLGFNIDPKGARDFSLMIQSIGMTSASIAIFALRIQVEKTVLIVGCISGALGLIAGLGWVERVFAPDPAKVFFVSLWLAFGAALVFMNLVNKGERHETIRESSMQVIALLGITGFLGGVVSSILGNGLDILIFAVVVLGLRICEKVATPTSVILMASNSVVGFAARGFFELGGQPISEEVWKYWAVSVPIVAIGAPAGAYFISKRGREFIYRFLIFLIVVQFAAALWVIEFSQALTLLSAATFLGGAVLFLVVWFWGEKFD